MYRRILSVQDVSCVGQCSMTVALPILSVCGLETAILPTALLSTHTAKGFEGFTFRDLSEDLPRITEHWEAVGITFDAVCTGYLGRPSHVASVLSLTDRLLSPGGKRIVDPAMADNGRLYTGLSADYVEAMKRLCASADVLLPNLTEACLLTDTPCPDEVTPAFVGRLMDDLAARCHASIVLTGVALDRTGETLTVCVRDGETRRDYTHPRVSRSFHGTGDVFAAAFTGAYLQGFPLPDAAELAADFTLRTIRATVARPAHWYGVRFEPELPWLAQRIGAGKV